MAISANPASTDKTASSDMLALYEHKIMPDKNFPIQMQRNHITKKGTYFYPHWHEYIEMHYIRSGSTTITCAQERYHTAAGDLLIANSNELHSGRLDDSFTDSLVLIFDYSLIAENFLDEYIIFKHYISGDAVIRHLFEDMFREDSWKEPGYRMVIKGKLYELLVYLYRNYAAEHLTLKENAARSRNLKRLNSVIRYIETHYSEPITIAGLAAQVNLSEYRFCHLFKEAMNQSPTNFVNEIRLKKARVLLKESDMPIARIAEHVGFNDFNNFGRQFRRLYGCAPSELRKANPS
ncbi:MAG: AraC family transcriptional regulator [Lachnospiraceae bacterium]|nr:AraC family transcriptional regulator [Lachnospiraceae bacterium]